MEIDKGKQMEPGHRAMTPMLAFSAVSANTASQVPFWIQILSISAAPILGFLGVAVGVFLTEQNRRGAYIRDEKRKAYIDFMGMLTTINTFWSSEFSEILEDPQHSGMSKIAGFSKSQIEALHRTFMGIRLVGSQNVIDAGAKCFSYVTWASATSMVMIIEGFDGKEWNEVTKMGVKVMAHFSEVARKDLGLPSLKQEGNKSAIESSEAKIRRFVMDRLWRIESRTKKADSRDTSAVSGA